MAPKPAKAKAKAQAVVPAPASSAPPAVVAKSQSRTRTQKKREPPPIIKPKDQWTEADQLFFAELLRIVNEKITETYYKLGCSAASIRSRLIDDVDELHACLVNYKYTDRYGDGYFMATVKSKSKSKVSKAGGNSHTNNEQNKSMELKWCNIEARQEWDLIFLLESGADLRIAKPGEPDSATLVWAVKYLAIWDSTICIRYTDEATTPPTPPDASHWPYSN